MTTPADPGPGPDLELDRDAYIRLLLRVERVAHGRGWDGEPHVRLIYDMRHAGTHEWVQNTIAANPAMGQPIGTQPYAAQKLFDGRMLMPAPHETLRRIALNLAYAPDRDSSQAMTAVFRQPGVIGLAVVYEAWGAVDEALVDQIDQMRAGRHMGDIPGNREMRGVRAVTWDGQLDDVRRWRGEQPEHHPATATARIVGDLATSLSLIAAVVRDDVPPPDRLRERWPSMQTHLDQLQARIRRP